MDGEGGGVKQIKKSTFLNSDVSNLLYMVESTITGCRTDFLHISQTLSTITLQITHLSCLFLDSYRGNVFPHFFSNLPPLQVRPHSKPKPRWKPSFIISVMRPG